MTVWDYLDKHEIVGTCLVLFSVFWTGACFDSVLCAWAKAVGLRAQRQGVDK